MATNEQITFPLSEKIKNNNLLGSYIDKYLCDQLVQALILDDKDHRTTLMLNSKATPSENIHAPEMDEETYHKHESSGLCTSYHQTIGSFILCHQNFLPKLNVGYFDYCGNLEGNYKNEHFPLCDLNQFLFRCADCVVLGITCSRRGKILRERTVKFVYKKYVYPIIKSCGFTIYSSHMENYRSKVISMVFMLFYLERNIHPDTNKLKGKRKAVEAISSDINPNVSLDLRSGKRVKRS